MKYNRRFRTKKPSKTPPPKPTVSSSSPKSSSSPVKTRHSQASAQKESRREYFPPPSKTSATVRNPNQIRHAELCHTCADPHTTSNPPASACETSYSRSIDLA